MLNICDYLSEWLLSRTGASGSTTVVETFAMNRTDTDTTYRVYLLNLRCGYYIMMSHKAIYHFVIYDLLFILSFSHLGHLVHSNTHYVVADTVTDDDDLAVLNQLLAVSCWLLADVLYAGSGGFVLDDTCTFD